MTEYVLGFLFDSGGHRVVLLRKNRPTWQAGFWNGVGGHIEVGESPLEAMCREFREETTVDLSAWEQYATLGGEGFRVHIFRAFSNAIWDTASGTDEPVMIYRVDELPKQSLPNLRWLIPMALSMDEDHADNFSIIE